MARPSAIDRLSDILPERPRPFKRAEYERLIAAGVFRDERVELLGGLIVVMSPQRAREASAVSRLGTLLGGAIGDLARVRVELPFAASNDSLPRPDVAVVPNGEYDDAHPETALLIVEVALQSLRKDRLLKAEVYALAGVPEYWIVNLVDGRLERYASPLDGVYTSFATLDRNESVRLDALGGVAVTISDVLSSTG